MIRPTDARLTKAIQTLGEVSDCVGHQLIHQGDRNGAALAAMILNLRKSRQELLRKDPRWPSDRPWGTEMEVSRAIEQATHPERASRYVLEDLDAIIEELAATDHYSSACTLYKTLSNSAARAFDARNSADGIRTRRPFAANSGIRFSFVAISPTRRPFDNANPEAPTATSAGISNRNPYGIACLTAVMTSLEPNDSVRTVESQKVAIVRMAIVLRPGE